MEYVYSIFLPYLKPIASASSARDFPHVAVEMETRK
jgi:hypothetical protein